MTSVQACDMPPDSFLQGWRAHGGYTDCYVTEIDGPVAQAAFVEAFYTTRLFKVERAILGWLAARPSTDDQARQLASGAAASFAAWRVERRSIEQLLLADVTGRTSSWLMAAPVGMPTGSVRTRLYFGSGVAPRSDRGRGNGGMGIAFVALLGFHRLYSRLLLSAARSRVLALRKAGAR